MDVNDNQPRGLLLCCSDLISICYQGIGIILFCSRCSQLMLSIWKVSIFVPKLGEVIFEAWVWLLAGTPVTIQHSSQQSAHSHMHSHLRSHVQYIHTSAYTHTHTPFTLPSAIADVPTWHQVPRQRFTLLHRIYVALLSCSIQVRHITSAVE